MNDEFLFISMANGRYNIQHITTYLYMSPFLCLTSLISSTITFGVIVSSDQKLTE